MAKLEVLNAKREKVAEMEVSERLLQEPQKPHLVHEVVRMQLAGRRSGTAATKERSFVSGGGRKPWKQKGTGRARSGSTRSPLWRKGGTVFGPHPRDYSFQPPKKVRQAALRSALASKLEAQQLLILEKFELEAPKTKYFAAALRDLGVSNALIVIDGPDEALERSSRNIPGVQVIRWEGLNVHDVLRHEHLILLRSTLESMERKLQP